jgi:peptidyl-prolyl cis-trans isomerase C
LQVLQSNAEFDGDIDNYGDAFMLQSYYPTRSPLEIRKLFGNGFSEAVFELEPGQWIGPVLSGYGTHLVYIHDHQKSELPAFEFVREQVKTDWMNDMQKKLNDRYIEGLMARYEIVFEESA